MVALFVLTLQVTGDNNVSNLIPRGVALLFSAVERLGESRNRTQTKMALTPQEVSRIAHLARLDLSALEQTQMLTQLNDFFDIVQQMSAVDTSGVEPLYTPLSAVAEVTLRLRDDVVTEVIDIDANQRSAPSVENGLLVAISGRDLEQVSDQDLPELADRTAVFARVAPEQKLRLVRALQTHGHVVAMTDRKSVV